ncbi:hypothetical protein ACLN6N_07360 [Sphingomonas carotinifaciens]|uniref:hypothetical protein n=1 Tax=Sphingomonas carotinifaciens TaxID=1166323 RepID=UPI00399F1116
MVLDGPINGGSFEAYVYGMRLPDLTRGDVVITINLSSYKRPDARLMFPRPTNPDFNPIKKPFARLKAILRKAEECC